MRIFFIITRRRCLGFRKFFYYFLFSIINTIRCAMENKEEKIVRIRSKMLNTLLIFNASRYNMKIMIVRKKGIIG